MLAARTMQAKYRAYVARIDAYLLAFQICPQIQKNHYSNAPVGSEEPTGKVFCDVLLKNSVLLSLHP